MNYQQKLAAAQNPNTPTKTLEQLATDKHSYVRSGVAENPNRTEIIERLVFMTDYKLSTNAA